MKKLLFLFAFLLILPVISAQPPLTQVTAESGLEILYPKYDYVKQNTGFTLHTSVLNLTSWITNSTGQCFVHIYNSQGVHTMKSNLSYEYPEFEVYIEPGNFSDLGIHAYVIQCKTSTQAGAASGAFEVTGNGLEPFNNDGLFFALIALAFIPIVLLFVFQTRREGLKVMLFVLTLIMATVISAFINYTIQSTPYGLSGLSLSVLTIYVISLFFFVGYFLVTYTKAIANTVKDSKKEKNSINWEN